MVCPAFRDKWWLIFGDVVRSRSGRLGEDKFHQPAGIFSVKASEGAAVSFLPPQGLENVHTAFQGAVWLSHIQLGSRMGLECPCICESHFYEITP